MKGINRIIDHAEANLFSARRRRDEVAIKKAIEKIQIIALQEIEEEMTSLISCGFSRIQNEV